MFLVSSAQFQALSTWISTVQPAPPYHERREPDGPHGELRGDRGLHQIAELRGCRAPVIGQHAVADALQQRLRERAASFGWQPGAYTPSLFSST